MGAAILIRLTTPGIMGAVMVALIPGIVLSVWFHGHSVLTLLAVAVATAVATEWLCTRRVSEIKDLSAVVTGLLIGLAVPSTAPPALVALATFVAIALAKHAYGGLGANIFNPAMVGYVAILVAFPQSLAEWDAISGATALDQVSHRGGATIEEIWGLPAFGAIGGAKSEWINAGFLIGGVGLVLARLAAWRIVLGVLLGMLIPAAIAYADGGSSSLGSPLFHWFTGGTMLVAFFIATDPVTSPSDRLGQFFFGFFIGVVALLVRAFGSWPDGLGFAVLLANILVPAFNRFHKYRLAHES